MKLLYVVLVAALCTSAFAAVDCTTFKTKDTCTDTTCKYSETNSCTNKCAGLTDQTCGVGDSANLCEGTPVTCTLAATNCAEANGGTTTDCSGKNPACVYVPLKSATCTEKSSASTDCDAKKSKESDCTGLGFCTFTEGALQSCAVKSSYCTGLSYAQCDPTYCTQIPNTCTPKTTCDSFDQAQCNQHGHCAWDISEIKQKCILNTQVCDPTSQSTCYSPLCNFVPQSCGNRQTDACGSLDKAGCKAADTACNATLAANTCTVTDDTCSVSGACPQAACTKVDFQPSTCSNPTCADTAPCGDGCTASVFSCNATASKTCKTDASTASACTDSGFCTFATTSSCTTSSDADGTNGVILAFTGLISLFAIAF